jgi:hypothetical protein
MIIRTLKYLGVIIAVLAVIGGFIVLKNDLSKESSSEEIIQNPPPPERAVIDDVIDALTLKLDSGHVVRYIGISVPETRAVVECYGRETLLANESMIGKSVRLEEDPVLVRARDGAWLRYIFTDEMKKKPIEKDENEGEGESGSEGEEVNVSSNEPNNESSGDLIVEDNDEADGPEEEVQYKEELVEYMVNERMIERGYAIPLLSKQMVHYDRLASAARYSNATGKGLWGACEVEEGENGLLKTQEVDDCVIKGMDLGEGQRVYRTKECLAYADSVVVQAHGDRWLCRV